MLESKKEMILVRINPLRFHQRCSAGNKSKSKSMNSITIKSLVKFWVVFVYLCLVSFTNRHPLKMSSIHIAYDIKSKTLTVETHFFADDFQKCVNQELNQRYNIIQYYDKPDVQQAVDGFTAKFLKLNLNGTALTLRCNKAQYNADANLFTFFYQFQQATLQKKNILEISNQLFLNYFNDQKNIVILNLPGLSGKLISFDKEYKAESVIF